MLFVSLTSFPRADEIPEGVDGLELRLDLFSTLDLLPEFMRSCPLPLLLTLRRTTVRTESQRESFIKDLFRLKPAFFDLEFDMRPEFLQWAFAQGIKIVLSYHNDEQTPFDLSAIYRSLSIFPAFTYKIAAYANSSCDALRLLLFSKGRPKLSAISMGEKGSFARVLGPVVANPIDFCFLNEATAPGQLSAAELLKIYRYKKLNAETALYGLIGDPVEASLGHQFHNDLFEENQMNAVYVKMVVQEGELASFFYLAKQLGFKGLSVTMPLKEQVLPKLGTINTLFLEEILTGVSVDGSATLDAIGDVAGQKVVVIGAGGSAHSIVDEAVKRGANVTIVNRTVEAAIKLANKFDCQAAALNQIPLNYDLIINCTPAPMPIAPEKIREKSTAVDLVYSTKLTPFLLEAKERGCRLVYGYTIFENQAKAQFALWKNR